MMRMARPVNRVSHRSPRCQLATTFLFSLLIGFIYSSGCLAKGKKTVTDTPEESSLLAGQADASTYQQYLDFFEEVYQTMERNYYYSVQREDFNRFLKKFDRDIYGRLTNKKEKINYITWRSAAFLVDYLKDPEDTFSAFIPPKPAKEFEAKVLGQKMDLGIEGRLIEQGYLVTRVEPHSDAYTKGLRAEDLILKIDEVTVLGLKEEQIKSLLTPLVDTTVNIYYLSKIENREMTIAVVSKEYFKQSVFMVPVHMPNVYCLAIRTFNRKTSDEIFSYLSFIRRQTEESSLILDLRGNPGGPPLAAREISAFFLTPGAEFAYFQKRSEPKASLDVPRLPLAYHYQGPIAILVDQESGSASELFSGIMQQRDRAVLIGRPTAGKVLLKSMFYFKDESMLLLVTARGHFPDGRVFPYSGLTPDLLMSDETVDLVNFAAGYLVSLKKLGK